MSIKNERQLKNTLEKLTELEKLYEETKSAPAENERVKELTLRSLKQTMNELKEEIGRFRAHVKAGKD
ncbi:MAG: hypothetical protein HY721_14250 [Planctomycetes bacterium]|nr:hypothetical protein [Planctomycetota bacterium]